jgi:hypothetical protein
MSNGDDFETKVEAEGEQVLTWAKLHLAIVIAFAIGVIAGANLF